MNAAALFMVVIGLGVAVFGAYTVTKSGRQVVMARAASVWSAGTATIDRATMNERVRRGGLRTGSRRYYSISVDYHYNVGGISYAGNVINPMYVSSANQADTLNLLSKLPQGADVQVRYNPAKPQQSSLTAGYVAMGASGLLLGIFILITGLLIVGVGLLELLPAASDVASRIVPG